MNVLMRQDLSCEIHRAEVYIKIVGSGHPYAQSCTILCEA